jgi:uncharacterized protein (AIM24 family)
MASSINASVSGAGGLISTADNSGILNIQSAGSTVLALTSSGVTVTGTGSVSGNLSFNSGYGSAAVAYGCRAWVKFNGTGTIVINGSGNVSSITDGGVGTYTVNITTAIVDANYSVVTTAVASGSINFQSPLAGTLTTTAFDLYTSNGTAATDSAAVCAAVFR